MTKQEQKARMINILAKFADFCSKNLPDDVVQRLHEMADAETVPIAKDIYKAYFKNLELAKSENRPACQDTGIQQYFVKVGGNFPLIGDINEILREATIKATKEAPLRHNTVETFEEKNYGTNVGTGAPNIFVEIVPDNDECQIVLYDAGGGCSLPGHAKVFMPGEGYEGVTQFVMERMTSYGLNACPPLLVGVGVANTIETASLLAKKAILRPIGTHNQNPNAAKMERLLEDGINGIGLGPQALTGDRSVMAVHIENACRHPACLAAAVTVSCWCDRHGYISFDKDLNYTITSHKEAKL